MTATRAMQRHFAEPLTHAGTELCSADTYTEDRCGFAGEIGGAEGLFGFFGWGGTGFKLAPSLAFDLATTLLGSMGHAQSTHHGCWT
jgi:glycine/D-amino acid oxidase-like deaminating enzyme